MKPGTRDLSLKEKGILLDLDFLIIIYLFRE